jgi:hypothetical protein
MCLSGRRHFIQCILPPYMRPAALVVNCPKERAVFTSASSASSAGVRLSVSRVGRECIGSKQYSCEAVLVRNLNPTDVTDGADILFGRSAHPDYSGSGSAFTTERNLDPKRLKKRLARRMWPAHADFLSACYSRPFASCARP